MARVATSIAAVLAMAVPAFAQEMPPPEVAAREITAGGTLTGCALDFTIAFKDHIYRKGAPTAVTGSLNLLAMADRSKIVGTVKLVGLDIGDTGLQPFKVETTSVFGRNGKPVQSAAVQCEDPRHFCGAFTPEAFVGVLMTATETGSVRLAFNRKPGGMDVPVSLPVKPETVLRLMECAGTLVGK